MSTTVRQFLRGVWKTAANANEKTGVNVALSGEQNHKRVLVIGLDGATFDLIRPLVNKGKMPNLARMGAEGISTELRSTILPLSPPAWTTFLTGKNPGGHGIYDFAKRVEGTYDFAPTTSMDMRSRAIWNAIEAQGGSSILVNVPLTYPPASFRGFMLSGFPTPTERRDYTYPPGLLQELEKEFGSVNIHKPKVLYKKGREREITDETLAITKQQTQVTKYLMGRIDWSLTVSVYDATDVLGHYFWAYLDPGHPKYDKRLAKEVEQMVEDIHVSLDEAIGEMTSAVGEDTLKVVMSDHGFGPVYYGVYVNNWLVSGNYMKFKKTIRVRAKHFAFRNGLNVYNMLRVARRLGLVKSIESAYATRSYAIRLLNMISLGFQDVDWDKTRVYSAGNMGQLYLNLVGREPGGIVKPEEAGPLVYELINKIKGLQDPANGRTMFDMVFAGREIYSGPFSANGPDVIFLDQKMVYAAHRMFELGSNSLVTLHPIYSGNHKMDGILFAEGRGVTPGSKPESKPNLVDLAPTILCYLGLRVPGEMEGQVISELSGGAPEVVQGQESQRVNSAIREILSKKSRAGIGASTSR